MSLRTNPVFSALLQFCLVMIALLASGVAPGYPQDLPIFDAHIHYSQPDWEVFTPDQVLAILDRAGVRHALVSSTPDDGTVEKMLQLYPQAKLLWAHAGMTASAATVGRLLDRFSNLWVELALRADVALGGKLDPEWQAVFLRHPERFMVGTDTWVTSRWDALEGGMQMIRDWLGQLPRQVAEQIAHRNAERLFAGP